MPEPGAEGGVSRRRALALVAPCILGRHVYCAVRVMGVVTTTTGGTAVLEKVFYTSVLVSDQDKALDFYTNVLGLEKRVENPTPDGPRFLTVGVKGDDFQLVLWPGTPGQAQPAMGRPPASVTIETDDCRKTVEELKSRGVEFVSDVLEFSWVLRRSWISCARLPAMACSHHGRAGSVPTPCASSFLTSAFGPPSKLKCLASRCPTSTHPSPSPKRGAGAHVAIC